jgi:hypothetical protein
LLYCRLDLTDFHFLLPPPLTFDAEAPILILSAEEEEEEISLHLLLLASADDIMSNRRCVFSPFLVGEGGKNEDKLLFLSEFVRCLPERL